jgi:hypothetical protein
MIGGDIGLEIRFCRLKGCSTHSASPFIRYLVLTYLRLSCDYQKTYVTIPNLHKTKSS